MAKTTFVQTVQAQNSTRKNIILCQESLYFLVYRMLVIAVFFAIVML